MSNAEWNHKLDEVALKRTILKAWEDGRLIIELDPVVEQEERADCPCVLCGEMVPWWMVAPELGEEFVLCSLCDDIAPRNGRTPVEYWNVTNRILLGMGHKMVAHLEGRPYGARVRRHEERLQQWRKKKAQDTPATFSTASTSSHSSGS